MNFGEFFFDDQSPLMGGELQKLILCSDIETDIRSAMIQVGLSNLGFGDDGFEAGESEAGFALGGFAGLLVWFPLLLSLVLETLVIVVLVYNLPGVYHAVLDEGFDVPWVKRGQHSLRNVSNFFGKDAALCLCAEFAGHASLLVIVRTIIWKLVLEIDLDKHLQIQVAAGAIASS